MLRILLLLAIVSPLIAAHAQKPADFNKAVVNVLTYDAQGNVLQSSCGFFIGTTGEVVAPFQALKGAAKVEIIDWRGQQANVVRIAGASSGYDLVRFTTDIPTKKLVGLQPAAQSAEKGARLLQTFYTTDKKQLPETTEITAADPYESHYYYTTSTANEARYVGCPVVNEQGEVVAIVQKNLLKDATTACAIDVQFALELSVTPQAAFSSDLNSLPIAKLLPTSSEDDAFSYTYMLLHSQLDSAIVMTTCEDFMAAYPENSRVYNERAAYFAQHGNYRQADADLQKSIGMGGSHVADAYNTLATLMYNKMLYATTAAYDPWPQWTLQTALTASEQAYAAAPQPVYLLQQGQILFSLQQYQAAYEKFEAVNATDLANAQTFFYASNALERADGDADRVIALLDSAVARFSTPYPDEAAPYLFARAQHLQNAGQHRRATADYTEYEKIIGPKNLTAYFYYLRMQAEVGSRMYQQALDDGATAVAFAKDDEEKADYLFELACLQLKVNLFSECLTSLDALLALRPDDAEAHKVYGIACGEKKDMAKARQYLQKAQALGAEHVETLLEKYR
ncbi:MAG: tetratricopeptide repeat protein [Alloprevotella sp.]